MASSAIDKAIATWSDATPSAKSVSPSILFPCSSSPEWDRNIVPSACRGRESSRERRRREEKALDFRAYNHNPFPCSASLPLYRSLTPLKIPALESSDGEEKEGRRWNVGSPTDKVGKDWIFCFSREFSSGFGLSLCEKFPLFLLGRWSGRRFCFHVQCVISC